VVHFVLVPAAPRDLDDNIDYMLSLAHERVRSLECSSSLALPSPRVYGIDTS